MAGPGLLRNAYAKSKAAGKQVIVIGIDGMDPRLSERLMDEGRMPTFAKMREAGGYRRLGTSTPPQSPVAWANFINGAGPGSHGIFDFIHRDPKGQVDVFYSAAETVQGSGYWQVGDHKLKLPLIGEGAKTELRRQGVPFWDYLDAACIKSVFYDLPSNYPPSKSRHGNHKCLSGMGTPDLLGSYGTYQYYSEDGPRPPYDESGGRRYELYFQNERARATLCGPMNTMLTQPEHAEMEFFVHRDIDARTALIEINGREVLLKEGQWSKWVPLDFELGTPWFLPSERVSGIVRFYLQKVGPVFRLYVSPVNMDPREPALQITEPPEFAESIAEELGPYYTTGFQEAYKALSNEVFEEDEFISQASHVLKERLALLDYALKNYDDGLLYFYFSSTDLQGHMLWWDSDDDHPARSREEAEKYFEHLKKLYCRMDGIVADIIKRYPDATVITMSDHGFANFKRQFNLNSWLRENGYLGPSDVKSVMEADWKSSRAYGLGINGLYVNTKGREKYGIVEPGEEKDRLLDELITKLEAIRDVNGQQVIRKVTRTDKEYKGDAMKYAPDLIVGYARGYRASWDTCLGNCGKDVLSDNTSAWGADHCADASEVPGVVFCNRPIKPDLASLVDIAPTVLQEFGLDVPGSMEGKAIV
ncbi:Type I phosphodiesterase / nucleotide pyrophosphatase [Anaerohalosphaera lusitana]|uniref:Type I phosphodiesterase / nucleotide pyrophosphatase n=2 Tax=Anaerohalosphaera lusitana TaxID=1936003 RepID=A0A1U9NKA6_9BACT|nr:Type I phosphodiesterase / nucleotide pyrophosphatase [Anaerohalosphaera lusitana]